MRIGILGGTFNPIHRVHLDIARAALDQLKLDRVIFVPAAIPPHKRDKTDIVGPEHRLRMTELAVADLPGAEVSDIEIRRQGPSYTVDTLRAFKEAFGPESRLFFIMGADQVMELPTWHEVEAIARLCQIVPVARPGYDLENLQALRGRLSDQLVHSLGENVLSFQPRDVSSTEIRRRLRRGQTVSGELPPQVENYIRRHQLYRDRAGRREDGA